MKKTALAALLAVILVLPLLYGCEKKPADQNESGTLATNDIVDYFFYYPKGWKLNTSTGMISLTADNDLLARTDVTNPEGNGEMGVFLRPQFSVTAFNLKADEYPTVQSYWDMCWAQYGSVYQNLELLSQEEQTVAGYDAYCFTFTGDIAGVTYQYEQTVFFAKSMAYALTYTSTPEAFDQLLSDVASMKSTFAYK